MAGALSDGEVVSALRPFVRATGPILEMLSAGDPLGLRARAADAAARGETLAELAHLDPTVRRRMVARLSAARFPGTPMWTRMSAEQRSRWWINRVGRFTTLLAAIPGLGGALASRIPVQSAGGAASQGLLLCAIAGEHGLTTYAERVQLLAWVLFRRDIAYSLAAGEHAAHDHAAEEAQTAALAAELRGRGYSDRTQNRTQKAEHERHDAHRRMNLRSLAVTLWRLGRSLSELSDQLDKRPRGRIWHRVLGQVPVLGMLAGYLGERSALKRVARDAHRYLARVHGR